MTKKDNKPSNPLARFMQKDPLKIRADNAIAFVLKNHIEPFGRIVSSGMMKMSQYSPTYVLALDSTCSYECANGPDSPISEMRYGFTSLYTPVNQREEFATLMWTDCMEPTRLKSPFMMINVPAIVRKYAQKFCSSEVHPLAFMVSLICVALIKEGWIPVEICDSDDDKLMQYSGNIKNTAGGSSFSKTLDTPVLGIEFYNESHPLKVCMLHLNYAQLFIDQTNTQILNIQNLSKIGKIISDISNKPTSE